jgi:glycosyltransferase involved in cell wall biosynthesis
MMRIGIEAQRIQRRKKHGMDIVAVELIRHLQQADAENEYFIFVKPGEDPDVIRETANFHIVEIPPSPYPYWEQVALPRYAVKYRLDLLHCTSNTAPLSGKIPLLITLHDIIYLEKLHLTRGTWYQRLGNIYRRWNVPKAYKKAARILTVSDFEKSGIQKFFGTETTVTTVYNAVSDHFKPVDDREMLEEMRKKYSLPPRFIFFLGNTDPKKNLRRVLKAYGIFLESSEEKLPLVMPDLDRSFLRSALQESAYPDLEHHIVLTGYVPNAELPYIYNLAEIFLYPSVRESFGIPVLEAMACGIPVIASNTSSLPEIAGDAALFADPYDEKDIAAQILLLLDNRELKKALSEKGIQRAKAFSWKRTAEQVKEIYGETIENKL